MSLLLPLLLAHGLVHDAEAAARVVITADAPVAVSINRHPYTPVSKSYAILCDPGRNRVQVGPRSLLIEVPNGHEARMTFSGGELTLTETVRVEGLAETDYVDYYYDPDEDPANSADGVILAPTTLTGEAATLAAQGPGEVHLRAAVEGQWFDVQVNGVPVAALRNFFEAEATLTLAPGPQHVEVFEGSSGRLVARGSLEVKPGATLELRLSREGLSVEGAQERWSPEG